MNGPSAEALSVNPASRSFRIFRQPLAVALVRSGGDRMAKVIVRGGHTRQVQRLLKGGAAPAQGAALEPLVARAANARQNASMSWFKLVGSTENPVPNYWDFDRPDLLTEIRFPWNKPPDDIWVPGNLILYAVGAGALIAVQEVNGPPHLLPRRGAPGTPQNRWPHKLAVLTKWVCSPVRDAPKLREAAPDFAEKYKGRFWNGSHWTIEDSEYKLLAGIIESAGSAVG